MDKPSQKPKKKDKDFESISLPRNLVAHVREIAKREGRLIYRVILDRFPEVKP